LEQARINENIHIFSSVVKEQITFNKKIELQIAHLASTLSATANPEQIKGISTRGGKSTCDPPYPKGARRPPQLEQVEEEEVERDNTEEEEVIPQDLPQDLELRQDFHDTNLLQFPHRNRRTKIDEQFGKFVEVIQKLYINIPLLDAMQVPTYAKYLWDILNNKRPLPFMEVIKLTEECSAVILNSLPVKKKDPGCPTIDCSIRDQNFEMCSWSLH